LKDGLSGSGQGRQLRYLAAEGRRHPRRDLAELLWPESDERHARTDLRSALAKLRKTLGEDSAPETPMK
jgi:DNA-binding SARP family transcriptional activator